MQNKLDKINELVELLKLGAINKDEFQILKDEILNTSTNSQISSENEEINELMESGLISKDEYELLNKNCLNEENQSKNSYEPTILDEYSINNSNESPPRGNNNKVYASLLFIAVILVSFIFIKKDIIFNSGQGSNLNKIKIDNTNSTKNNQFPISSRVINNDSNIKSHLQNNTFSVNGNGSVYFSINSKRYGETKHTGTITVRGGRATLQGDISILDDSSILIYNFRAVDGYYDASINEGSTGVFYLNSSGDLYGKLSAHGKTKSVKFILKR